MDLEGQEERQLESIGVLLTGNEFISSQFYKIFFLFDTYD